MHRILGLAQRSAKTGGGSSGGRPSCIEWLIDALLDGILGPESILRVTRLQRVIGHSLMSYGIVFAGRRTKEKPSCPLCVLRASPLRA